MENKALRYNEGKLDWTLIDFKSLKPLVRVMEYGVTKYDRDNWKKPNDTPKEHIQSCLRHLIALSDGEEVDPESGELHAGHIMANMMMYIYQNNKKLEETLSNLFKK